ncbi:hypothetical protein P7C70_g5824, partial [Phenoliferia sp. Uapishka_3]
PPLHPALLHIPVGMARVSSKAPRKRRVYPSDAGATGRQSKTSLSAAAASAAAPNDRASRAKAKSTRAGGAKNKTVKEKALSTKKARGTAAKNITAPAILAEDIVVGVPPAFPIIQAPPAQTVASEQRTPPSPTTSATELEDPSNGAAIPPVPVSRQLACSGAVVLDSSIHPDLCQPSPSATDISATERSRSRSLSIPASGHNTSAAGRAVSAVPIAERDRSQSTQSEKGLKVGKPKVPKPNWSDALATLAYLKLTRAHIGDLTKRANHYKKAYFKMRRDAMALEIQTGCYVGLFVCKSHKNRDDDQHAYQFHFSDTLIHNVVLVEIAKNLKKDMKSHMHTIWASGVGQGESDLIISQRAQLEEARTVEGTLRAQATVAQERHKGQAKEMKKQGKKLADMRACLKALGDDKDSDSSSDDSSDSDSGSDGSEALAC